MFTLLISLIEAFGESLFCIYLETFFLSVDLFKGDKEPFPKVRLSWDIYIFNDLSRPPLGNSRLTLTKCIRSSPIPRLSWPWWLCNWFRFLFMCTNFSFASLKSKFELDFSFRGGEMCVRFLLEDLFEWVSSFLLWAFGGKLTVGDWWCNGELFYTL